MHFWGATSQKINERRVEGHDGVSHVNNFFLVIPVSRPNGGESREWKKNR